VTTVTATQIEAALKDITAIKQGQVVEAIKNPKDLQNTLGVLLEIATVASVFFPQITAILDIIKLGEDFIPLLEAGAVVFHLHLPTPDLDPMHDAQLTHGGGDLK
jgi:hypothetical protein